MLLGSHSKVGVPSEIKTKIKKKILKKDYQKYF